MSVPETAGGVRALSLNGSPGLMSSGAWVGHPRSRCWGGVGEGQGMPGPGGYSLPCDLSNDACDNTYPRPHVDRQMPVKTLPSQTSLRAVKIAVKEGRIDSMFLASFIIPPLNQLLYI